ncbi:MAG: hypothetical protein J5945_03315 [Candidatus Methanomethylophilus sp.]|nr:hypothetical protein [Methanomethylophilus sp.]
MDGKLPTKSALLKSFKEGPMWDYEAVEKIQTEYGIANDYWKFTLRFYLMELSGGGMLEVIEEDLDNGSHFKPDSVVFKYRLTDFGKMRVETLLE